jgi:flagellar hook-associated protein 2
MAVDYLSAINQGGSGLNITQIVDSLVEAETAPEKDKINADVDA